MVNIRDLFFAEIDRPDAQIDLAKAALYPTFRTSILVQTVVHENSSVQRS
jgi:hypothetical protein